MERNATGAILIPVSLTWSEAVIVLAMMKRFNLGPESSDPAISTLHKTMRHVVESVELFESERSEYD